MTDKIHVNKFLKLLHNNQLSEVHLLKIPTLSNCPRWDQVKEIGSVIHKTKFTNYTGIIVSYGNYIYFVRQDVINVLSSFRKWKVSREIHISS